MKRVRIEEFFHDYDKLRKGTVGEAAFRTCIGTLKMGLSDAEIQTLVDRYRQADGLIHYQAFLDRLNTVWAPEADLSATIQSVKAQAVFSDDEKEAMLEAVTNMNNKIKAERILLKPAFEDFDRSH
jgi:hypothetical protein